MKKFILLYGIILSAFILKNEPEKSVPIKKDSLYLINVHNQVMEIDPSNGGRIASLKIDGTDFLTGKTIHADNWGSTFWPSPQSAWGWPPPAEIDKNKYRVSIKNNSVIMTSAKDSAFGYSLKKEIFGNISDTSFAIKYTITNLSEKIHAFAPWEISRVFPGGITFYPTGEGEKRGELAPLTEDINGITWFSYQKDNIPSGIPKLFSDGKEGWMAQLNKNILLVKTFPDVPFNQMAPEEGEIELYTNPDKSYIEIEHQGYYNALLPRASRTWEVKWYLRKLPEELKFESGNQDLVNYARKLKSNK